MKGKEPEDGLDAPWAAEDAGLFGADVGSPYADPARWAEVYWELLDFTSRVMERTAERWGREGPSAVELEELHGQLRRFRSRARYWQERAARLARPKWPGGLMTLWKRDAGVGRRARGMVEREDLDATDAEEIRHYIRIYSELRSLGETLRDRARLQSPLDSRAVDPQLKEVDDHARRIGERLSYWQRRFWELHGLDLDGDRLELRYRDAGVDLTRRDYELLDYLLMRTGEFVRPSRLLSGAWGDRCLSEEQLRTYVVRLRRKLADLNCPMCLVSDRKLGYALRSQAQGGRERRSAR